MTKIDSLVFRLTQRTLFNSFSLLHSFTCLPTYRHSLGVRETYVAYPIGEPRVYAMAESNYLGLPHYSIIKPWVESVSKESGLNSDDESEARVSSLHLDASTQTLSMFHPYKSPVDCPVRQSASTPSLVLMNRPEVQQFSESLPQVLPKVPAHKMKKQPIGLRPSVSAGHLGRELKRRTTSDSGIDDDHHPPVARLERVTIYGLDKEVYIANRFDFDPLKISEYRRRKREETLLGSSSRTPSSISSQLTNISARSSAKPSKIRASLTRLFKRRR